MSSDLESSDFNSEKERDTYEEQSGNVPTCRICMLEGTPDNPLFHPCKCKGSIRYVHQSCLIEWLKSKNVDINNPDANMVCSICNHPFEFETLYDESMPQTIPFTVFVKHSVIKGYRQFDQYFKYFLIFVLFVIGIPLSWNIWGKLFTAAVDDFSFPRQNSWYVNLVFGFEEYVPETPSKLEVLNQLVSNYAFSLTQIFFVIVIHGIAYLQYDMVVREPVFNKMIIHKIGPRFTKKELAMQTLRGRFPNMDARDIDMLINALHRNEPEDVTGDSDDEEPMRNEHNPVEIHDD